MLVTRIAIAVMLPGLTLLIAGCDRAITSVQGSAQTAEEERDLTAPHISGSGINVRTDVGSVEVIADPSANEVKITARVTAFGDTVDEAKSRLQNIKINVNRRDDQVLEVTAETPKAQNSAGTCSFAIRLPSVNGSTVRTGNGAVTLTGLGGPAELFTSVGSITVADHGDKVTAESGNGAIHITKVAGDVQVTSSVGQVRVQECGGSVKAKSGNGSLEITKAKGPVAARTSVGSVTVRDVSDSVMAETGNGAVTVVGVRGAVTAKASVGQVKLEQVSGDIKAETGNGSMTYTPAAGSAASFSLRSSVGSIAVHLPGSAAGSVQAETSVGAVTVDGSRQPRSITGDRTSKLIVLSEEGPASKVHTGNGSVMITLE